MAEIEEEEELSFREDSTSRGRKRRRTPQEIAVDKQKTWELSMDKSKIKNKRQVDAATLGKEHRGLHIVMRKGLTFWTED